MLPSDTNLNIKTGTVGYNNKILVSDGNFNPGKNGKVNACFESAEISHKDSSHKVVTQTTTTHVQKPTITHKEEKIALILYLTGTFTICYMF